MNKEMNPIETKEIRGISLKNIVTLIACTITICSTVMGSYFSLQSNQKDMIKIVDELRMQRVSDKELNDIRMRDLDIRIQGLEIQYKELYAKYEDYLKNKK